MSKAFRDLKEGDKIYGFFKMNGTFRYYSYSGIIDSVKVTELEDIPPIYQFTFTKEGIRLRRHLNIIDANDLSNDYMVRNEDKIITTNFHKFKYAIEQEKKKILENLDDVLQKGEKIFGN